jgi:hemerythrin-like domain-containing protein
MGNGDPIEVLMHEHRVIERMLKVRTAVAQKTDIDEEVDADTFEKTIDFIRTFADRCHHAKEEGELFPLIERRGIPQAALSL